MSRQARYDKRAKAGKPIASAAQRGPQKRRFRLRPARQVHTLRSERQMMKKGLRTNAALMVCPPRRVGFPEGEIYFILKEIFERQHHIPR